MESTASPRPAVAAPRPFQPRPIPVSQLFALFPTPVMRVEHLLSAADIGAITADIEAKATLANAFSDRLTHTPVTGVGTDPAFARLAALALPQVTEFGTVLFGEALNWQIKEIWVNVLDQGGHQAVHTHANSFVSGVIYLTQPDPSANLVFHKAIGGNGFIFGNTHQGAQINAYNGGKWRLPECHAGDLVLFPSYLLHEVPVNRGGPRISIAFNAIPDRLDNFGYAIRFA